MPNSEVTRPSRGTTRTRAGRVGEATALATAGASGAAIAATASGKAVATAAPVPTLQPLALTTPSRDAPRPSPSTAPPGDEREPSAAGSPAALATPARAAAAAAAGDRFSSCATSCRATPSWLAAVMLRASSASKAPSSIRRVDEAASMPESGIVFRIAAIICATSSDSNSRATSAGGFDASRRCSSTPSGVVDNARLVAPTGFTSPPDRR